MRHAQRRNLRLGAYMLVTLFGFLMAGALAVVRLSDPEIRTIEVVRYLPGEKCVGLEAEAGSESPLLRRILKHRPRTPAPDASHRSDGAAVASCVPDAPHARREGRDGNSVPEPSTVALIGIGSLMVAVSRRG